MKLWDDILDILQAPFTGDLDLEHIVLLLGVLLVLGFLTALILNHVRLAAAVEV